MKKPGCSPACRYLDMHLGCRDSSREVQICLMLFLSVAQSGTNLIS